MLNGLDLRTYGHRLEGPGLGLGLNISALTTSLAPARRPVASVTLTFDLLT